MDGRFNPYDAQGQQRQQAQALQAALEMEEALYLQRQQQDLQIRQMLLQDQIDQQLMQAPTASMLHQQRMYELQNYAAQNPLAALQEEQFLQQQLQQQEQLRHQQLQQELNLSAALGNQPSPGRRVVPEGLLADSVAASQATAAVKPAKDLQRKRSASQEDGPASAQPHRKKAKRERSSSSPDESEASLLLAAATTAKKKPRSKQGKKSEETKKSRKAKKDRSDSPVVEHYRGTVEELVAAAAAEQQVQDAASAVVILQKAEWSDSEPEDITPAESIELPGFVSSVPRLPEEPEYDFSLDKKAQASGENVANGDEGLSQSKHPTTKKGSVGSKATTGASKSKASSGADYPFPVDTWWPSNTTIKRERRLRGEKSDEEDCADEPVLANEESLFRADLPSVRSRLLNNIEPGVLEKLPHCKISKLRAKGQKGGVVKSEPVFCWQVTENTCNDVMLCCSRCSTWRHAFCGGHYKPFTVRGMLNSNAPFAPVCDRCHQEEEVLRDFPKAQARIDRQRIEQTRRGLATSAVIRQASFAKHGGTYKWPLGSVSTTHIGGHTRSVHSRHDKAEKQWGDMAIRLGRGLGYRPKERVKVRTRELERLLVSVEDAEGIMDRHNMLLFLQRDTSKDHPVGFERNQRNLFDPEDDIAESAGPAEESNRSSVDAFAQKEAVLDNVNLEELGQKVDDTEKDDSPSLDNETEKAGKILSKATDRQCARSGCCCKPRFDSMFCSDACGVSALESNLLHSLEYAGDIHPSLLRS